MIEEWRSVIGYEGEYEISNYGRVKSLKNNREKILKTFKGHRGYERINLMKHRKLKQVFVHRLVAEAFIEVIKEGLYVNHIDGNKTNNRVENLEIVTQRENVRHSIDVLKNNIKPVYQIDVSSLKIIKGFNSAEEAYRETGVLPQSIGKCCKELRNAAGGFIWIYQDDYSLEIIEKKKMKIIRKKNHKRRQVAQIDSKTNNTIANFYSIREAKEKTGISTISHCCNGYIKTAGGFIWKYID
ncbi:HNH endonuclease [Bacillus mycoides]|uniref:HNH endonuclease n=1 Tax=Bacillus mycoides TaxID=1405 RepID=UPI002E1E347E|nr:HNH endonuclease [Bacillus mycoides]